MIRKRFPFPHCSQTVIYSERFARTTGPPDQQLPSRPPNFTSTDQTFLPLDFSPTDVLTLPAPQALHEVLPSQRCETESSLCDLVTRMETISFKRCSTLLRRFCVTWYLFFVLGMMFPVQECSEQAALGRLYVYLGSQPRAKLVVMFRAVRGFVKSRTARFENMIKTM